ncbi:hypothetical protein ACROYT_G030163 [Oculina patagonica]
MIRFQFHPTWRLSDTLSISAAGGIQGDLYIRTEKVRWKRLRIGWLNVQETIMFFMVAAISSLVAVIVFVAITLLAKYQALAPVRKIPGPKPSFLFGNALQLARTPDGLLKQILQWSSQFNGGMFCLWLSPVYSLVLLYKPELIEILLSSSKHTSKSPDYIFVHPWLGTDLQTAVSGTYFFFISHTTEAAMSFTAYMISGLLITDGSKWKTRRRLITPTFHFKILNNFIQVFEEQAAILVTQLEKNVKKGPFNIMPYISHCALDIICITSMDSSPNAQGDANSPYVNTVLSLKQNQGLTGFEPTYQGIIAQLVEQRTDITEATTNPVEVR